MRLQKEHEELLKSYIEIESVTANNNSAVVEFLNRLFTEAGWTTTVIESPVYPGLFNFAARMKPAGHSEGGDFVITGHSDTVESRADDWDNKSPFRLDFQDGVYFGNGVADTKGPTMTGIIAALELCRPEDLKRPVSFWIDHSEENRAEGLPLKGAYEMVDWALNENIAVDAMIAVEPTGLVPINSHNGYAEVVVETRGEAAHSSIPEQGVNAIENMAGVIVKLKELRQQLRTDYDMPLNIGYIDGGRELQINVVAEECRIILDYRCRPQSITNENVLDKIIHLLGPDGAGVKFNMGPIQPIYCDPESEIIKIVSEISGEGPKHVSYYTDAAAYTKLIDEGWLKDGICVFGCGDIKHAHAPNERVAAEELLKGIECFKSIIRSYCLRK
jgi:acetylornithine deacetylase/succinyl-diaminopimelate desuccinylase-like protein